MATELQEYVEQARHCPTLLAARLAHVGPAGVRARLRCDEASALRLLICEQPCVTTWDRDVALIAACAGVDRDRLDRLLREAGAGDGTDWPQVLRHAREGPPGSGESLGRQVGPPSRRREGPEGGPRPVTRDDPP